MKHIIALSLVKRVGSISMRRLISCLGSAEAVMGASVAQLTGVGISAAIAADIISGHSMARAQNVIDICGNSGVRILTCDMDDFPIAFTNCPDAPCVLYVRGEVNFNSGRWLSVVGTRNATPQGVATTGRMIRDITMLYPDTVIVSGLAFGIDKAAHSAAMQYKVKTIAIMAGWVDDIVPKTNYYIAREILKAGGAIVSDMPPCTVIERGNFLSRNRIIAGLSAATIVVESAARGGSLVTADIASSYNKEVFALPGDINEPACEGTNMLIRSNKAIMYQSAEDVALALGWERAAPVVAEKLNLHIRLQKAYNTLPAGVNLDTESLSELWDVPLWEASSIVGQLRAKGLMAADPYKCYYKI